MTAYQVCSVFAEILIYQSRSENKGFTSEMFIYLHYLILIIFRRWEYWI